MFLLLLLSLSLLTLTTGAGLSIVKMSDGKTYPEPCATICSGVHGNWRTSNNYPGKVYTKVDISACKFVSAPIVTATLNVPLYASLTSGGVAVRQRYGTSFYAYVEGDISQADQGWELMWSASGYNCQ